MMFYALGIQIQQEHALLPRCTARNYFEGMPFRELPLIRANMYEIQKITDYCSGKEGRKVARSRRSGQETSSNTPFRDDVKASGVNESTYASGRGLYFISERLHRKPRDTSKVAGRDLWGSAQNNRGQKYPVPVPASTCAAQHRASRAWPQFEGQPVSRRRGFAWLRP